MIEISATLSFLVLGSDGQAGLALCQYFSERRVPYQHEDAAVIQVVQVLEDDRFTEVGVDAVDFGAARHRPHRGKDLRGQVRQPCNVKSGRR